MGRSLGPPDRDEDNVTVVRVGHFERALVNRHDEMSLMLVNCSQ